MSTLADIVPVSERNGRYLALIKIKVLFKKRVQKRRKLSCFFFLVDSLGATSNYKIGEVYLSDELLFMDLFS